MRELYIATEAVFRGGRGSDPAAHFTPPPGARRRTRRASGSRPAATIPTLRAWATAMEDAYFTGFTARGAGDALRPDPAGAAAQGGAAAAGARSRADRNAAEIAIAATRPAAACSPTWPRVIAGFGANVVGAQVYTSRAGQALDVFYVQDVTGAPFGGRTTRARSTAWPPRWRPPPAARPPDFEPRARGRPRPRRRLHHRRRRWRVDNDASEAATVVEVSGRDRPGLLEALARTLADAGLSIQSAHIDGYGERAVDAFYVTEPDGAKLTDPKQIAALKAGADRRCWPTPTTTPASPRLKLERARASVAR